MSRLTSKQDGLYKAEQTDLAIQKLGKFEDLFDEVVNNDLSKQLDELRRQGKEKTMKFKETMSRKLAYTSLEIIFSKFGPED